jgi:hypothetical protein
VNADRANHIFAACASHMSRYAVENKISDKAAINVALKKRLQNSPKMGDVYQEVEKNRASHLTFNISIVRFF